MIDARELDRRLKLFRRPVSDDGFSSAPADPQLIKEVWAKKTDIRDGERLAAAQQGQTITSRFLVRYSPLTASLEESDQVECENVRYEVQGTKEARGRKVGIEITATALRS